MKDLDFKPVFSELLPIVKNLIFSTAYFGRHCGRSVVITIHQNKTVLITLKDDQQWSIDFHSAVSWRGKSIQSCDKIDGCKSMILLLSRDGNLWQLINAFEFSNEKDECLYLIDEKCFYEWVPLRKLEGFIVLNFIAFQNGFAFLMENRKQKKRILQVHSSDDLNHVQNFTYDDLNLSESGNFLLHKVCFRDASKYDSGNLNEALIIKHNSCGSVYVCASAKKVSLVNVSNLDLISVLTFDKVKCLLLCYKNGKLLLIIMRDDFSVVKESSVYLLSKIVCIEKCECSESCIVWSDGINLHHTKIQFSFENLTDFVKLVHLEVSKNITGIRFFLRIHNGLLAVTINSFYYHIYANSLKEAVEHFDSTNVVLSKIYDCGLKINSLNEEIFVLTDYFKIKEIIQMKTHTNLIELSKENDKILIKSNLKYTFKKNYWRIRQEACIDDKHFVQMNNLDIDLCEGMNAKISSSLMSMSEIDLCLVGDYGCGFDLLVMHLGMLKVDENKEHVEVAKNLQEIARQQNKCNSGRSGALIS